MDFVALGNRIRENRKQQRMTQHALANAANVSASYIGHIERGLKRCSVETLVDIANALNTTPDILLQDSIPQSEMDSIASLSNRNRAILMDVADVLRSHE